MNRFIDLLARRPLPARDSLLSSSVVEPGKAAWKLIKTHFGEEVLLSDGCIDRPKLARIIFADRSRRMVLNKCTHPFIRKTIVWQIIKYFLRGIYIY